MAQESCSPGKLPVDSKWSCIGLCACFMGHFLAVGCVAKCFGVYFVDLQEKYDASAADTAWIISITLCIMSSTGIVGNGLFNWVGPRRATFVGAWLSCTGFALSSIVQKIHLMYLTFSGITGVGCGILYAVSISAAGQYFHKYRGLAIGITQAGSGLGSFCWAPLARYFTNMYGVSGNMLLLGGVMLHMAVFSMFHTPKEFHEMQYRLKQNRLRRKACNAATSGTVNSAYKSETETVFETHCSDVIRNDNHIDDSTKTKATEHVSPGCQSNLVSCTECLRDASEVHLQEKLSHQAGESKLTSNIESEKESEVSDRKQYLSKSDDLKIIMNSPLTSVCPAICPNKQLCSDENACICSELHNDICQKKSREPCIELSCRNILEQQNINTNFNEPKSKTKNDNSAINNSIKMSSYCDLSLLKNSLLLLYAGTFALLLPPYFSLFVMLPPHATQFGFSDSSIAMLVSIIGITEVVFRIVNGFIIDRQLISNHILYKMSAAVMAIGFCLIPSLRSYAFLAVMGVVIAFAGSLFVNLMPIILREGIGEKHFPIAFGIAMFPMSPMFLAIPVIVGKLCDVTGRWNVSFYTMGSLAMAAAIISLLHPWAASHQRPQNNTVVNELSVKVDTEMATTEGNEEKNSQM